MVAANDSTYFFFFPQNLFSSVVYNLKEMYSLGKVKSHPTAKGVTSLRSHPPPAGQSSAHSRVRLWG